MANDNSFASLLDDSFSTDDVDSRVSKLKDALEDWRKNFEMGSMGEVLQECLSSCPHESLEEKVFAGILPIAQRSLFEVVQNINRELNASSRHEDWGHIKRELFACHELLDFWRKCVEHVSGGRNVSAVHVKLLSDSVLAVIKLIFGHCIASSQLYATLLETVPKELVNLFGKAKTILKLYLATLGGVIAFDTDTESETELLTKVINEIGFIATIANELDIKTFAETIKAFGRLAITYQNRVQRISPENVTSPLKEITGAVSGMILTLKKSPDEIEENRIKVLRFVLMILGKLFASYCTCIKKEHLFAAIDLLLQMHSCSPSRLRGSKMNEQLINLMNDAVFLGCEPFLNAIFENRDFKQAYFEHRDKADIDRLSYHSLTLSIIKKLVDTSHDLRSAWTLGADSILDNVLTNINAIQEEIFAGEVRFPGAHDIGERPRCATIYEATLVPICNLIAQTPADEFYAIELVLLKHLLSNQFWSSLLSMDAWCFIGRLGSPLLCLSYVKYLLRVHAALAKRRNALEVVMLKSLIARLYAMLSKEMQSSLARDLDDDDHLWIPIVRFLPSTTKSVLLEHPSFESNAISDALKELQLRPTVQNWDRFTMLVSVIGELGHSSNGAITNTLSELWNTIASTLEHLEGRQLDVVSDFIVTLLNATRADSFRRDSFVTILEAISSSSLSFPPQAKVAATHYLSNNAKSLDCDLKSADVLAELSCRLLEDKNPWVRQEAVESLVDVTHMCPNEDVVTRIITAVKKKPTTKDFVYAYFTEVARYELLDFSDVRLYLRRLGKKFCDPAHVCHSYEESERVEKLPRMDVETSETSVAVATSTDLDKRVEKMCDELESILKKEQDVGDNILRRLRLICERICKRVETSK